MSLTFDFVRSAASGRAVDILVDVAGIDRELLDGRHHPCPRCGGRDRFRLLDPDKGAVICNQCFDKKNGDCFAAVAWMLGIAPAESLRRVAEYVGVNGATAKRKASRPTSSTTKESSFRTADDAVNDWTRKLGPSAGRWNYRDARGELVAIALRFNRPDGTKEFRPVSRNGSGWVKNAPVAPRALYRLDEIVSLPKEVRVYVCEGKKAADAARSVGLVATTSYGGAQAANKTDLSPLVGRDVVVLPDHDEPGRKYARAVTELLGRLKPRPTAIRIVELPDLADGDDVVEFIAARQSFGDVRSIIRDDIDDLAESVPVVDQDEPALPSKLAYRPFPVEAIPQPARDFIVQVAASMVTDVGFVGVPVLAALAVAIGGSRRIRLKGKWNEPVTLWTVTVGESGVCKSPPLDVAMQPLHDQQGRDFRQHAEDQEAFDVASACYEAAFAKWKKKPVGEPPEKPQRPIAKRLLTSDSTIEALACLLHENPRGVSLVRDELAGWIGSFDRYSVSKKNSDAANWISIHSSKPLIVDRKTGTPRTIHIQRPVVSVCGSIQPGILKRSLAPEHQESGLAARLLFAWPPRRPKKWTEMDVAADTDEPQAVLVDLTPAAKQKFVRFFDEHNDELLEFSGNLAAAWSKLESYALRFALIVHCVRLVTCDPTLTSGDVDEHSIEAGIVLARWFGHEARRVYELLEETEEQSDDRQLVEWIRAKGGEITPRDLQRGPRRFRGLSADIAESELQKLVDAGLADWKNVPTGPMGGRPSRLLVLRDE